MFNLSPGTICSVVLSILLALSFSSMNNQSTESIVLIVAFLIVYSMWFFLPLRLPFALLGVTLFNLFFITPISVFLTPSGSTYPMFGQYYIPAFFWLGAALWIYERNKNHYKKTEKEIKEGLLSNSVGLTIALGILLFLLSQSTSLENLPKDSLGFFAQFLVLLWIFTLIDFFVPQNLGEQGFAQDNKLASYLILAVALFLIAWASTWFSKTINTFDVAGKISYGEITTSEGEKMSADSQLAEGNAFALLMFAFLQIILFARMYWFKEK